MSDKAATAGAGGGVFLPLLTLVFITLKLAHIISWSWWWVLAPLWVPVLLALVFGILVVILVGRQEAKAAKRKNSVK